MAFNQDGDGMEGINRQTSRGRLLHPAELTRKVKDCQSRARSQDAVLGQVGLARRQGKPYWIEALANELISIRFHTREWVQNNVRVRRPDQEGPSENRDIRLKTNRNLQRVVVDMGKENRNYSEALKGGEDVEVDPATEEKLLATSPVKERASRSTSASRSEKEKLQDRSREPSGDGVRVKRQKVERQTRHVAESCPVERCGAAQRMTHALGQHVPEVFHPSLSGGDVTNRRIGALKLASRWLLGQRASLDGLVRYLDHSGAIRQSVEPDAEVTRAMRELCSRLQVDEPDDFTVRRSGNHVSALVHWKVLLNLVSLLEGHQMQELRSMFSLEEEERALLPTLPAAFDSHCHLDRTMNKLGMKTPSLAVINAALCPAEPYEVEVTRVVGVFCDPRTYPTPAELQRWRDQGVIPVVGLHPTRQTSDKAFKDLEALLKVPGVAGLGEVGLDHLQSSECWVEQMLKLQRALTLLRPEHILILHARSLGQVADEAIMSLMFQLQAHPNVKPEQLIHLHCFTGSTVALGMWLDAFPNTYFGVTSVVDQYDPAKNPDQTAALKAISRDRLLLETDAPYFSPRGFPYSTPGLIGMTAMSVGRFLGVPWLDVLAATKLNAERLYIQKQPPACVTGPKESEDM